MYLYTHPYVSHMEVNIHRTVFVYFSSIASTQTDLGKLMCKSTLNVFCFPEYCKWNFNIIPQ